MSQRTCPHCKQPIYDDDALLCLYCGQSLQERLPFPGSKTILVIVVILVLLGFLAMVIR